MSNHVVVWMDHKVAHVIHFTRDAAETELIKTHSTHPHLHVKSGIPGPGHVAENVPYFVEIAHAINDAIEILIVGPGFEKLEFMKYLLKHQPAIGEKVLSVETVDHPTDHQILAYARKYFIAPDQFL